MNDKIISPEQWLNEHCKFNDWSSSSETLHDSLYTNNVINYMKEYAEYIKSTIKEVHILMDFSAHGDETIHLISLNKEDCIKELEDYDDEDFDIITYEL